MTGCDSILALLLLCLTIFESQVRVASQSEHIGSKSDYSLPPSASHYVLGLGFVAIQTITLSYLEDFREVPISAFQVSVVSYSSRAT